ncbi:MAG: MBL fold metallo-hydrolase [Phycisphaeraceae bacterium]|nr:MBL fold metallo-hydrolase [Phycisphaeraceae bacterium]
MNAGSQRNEASQTTAPRIRRFTLGPFETNCYVVSPAAGGDCWVVDASFDPDPIIKHIRLEGLRPVALVLTHAHVDHLAGVGDVVRAFPGLPVWIHEAEREWLTNPLLNLSAMMGAPVTAPGPDRLLHADDDLPLGDLRWRVLHTPGHSPGGVTFHHAPSGTALVGDTLFSGSIGRSDFPGSDESLLHQSIRDQLYTLPESTRVLPGHGPETTIGREKRSNPFVRG